jgi:hypothetical protein
VKLVEAQGRFMSRKATNRIEQARPSPKSVRWQYEMPINGTYIIDLMRLAEDYERYVNMTDKQFEKNLVKAAHYAVYVSYYKNLSPMDSVSDEGVVHMLIHLIQFKKEKEARLYKHIFPLTRAKFKELLKIDLPKCVTP